MGLVMVRPWTSTVALGLVLTSAAFADPLPLQVSELSPVAVPVPPVPVPPVSVSPSAPVPRDTLTVVIAGDLGFGGSDQPVSARGAIRHGQTIPFAEMFQYVAPWLVADVVFANLETVVTEQPDLRPVEKTFNFRSHPAGLRYLAGLGLNAVSLANNHAIDYGEAGLRDTLAAMTSLRSAGLQAAPGVGMGRTAALAPGEVRRGPHRVHIAALGIGGGGLSDPRSERAGMAAYPADLTDTAAALGATTGDLRLLSVHYNQEMSVRPSGEDSRRLREVVQRHEIDLVAGHHAHVAAGVQIVDGALIFYGLGNFAHPGMQDMGRYGACRDYGLMARVHYSRVPGERFVARAVEVVTLDDMHMAPRPRTGADGQARIAVLNHLADGLDVNDGIRGVRFVPRADGTGIYCAAGAAAEGGAIGALCKAASVEAESAAANVKRAGAACGGDVIARRREGPVEPVVRPASTNASLVQPFASLRDFRVEAIDR